MASRAYRDVIRVAETAMQRLALHVNSLADHKSRYCKGTDIGDEVIVLSPDQRSVHVRYRTEQTVTHTQ